jgi:hypothetical protein
MKIKTVPPDEVFLGLAVGSTVLLIQIGLLALLMTDNRANNPWA